MSNIDKQRGDRSWHGKKHQESRMDPRLPMPSIPLRRTAKVSCGTRSKAVPLVVLSVSSCPLVPRLASTPLSSGNHSLPNVAVWPLPVPLFLPYFQVLLIVQRVPVSAASQNWRSRIERQRHWPRYEQKLKSKRRLRYPHQDQPEYQQAYPFPNSPPSHCLFLQ